MLPRTRLPPRPHADDRQAAVPPTCAPQHGRPRRRGRAGTPTTPASRTRSVARSGRLRGDPRVLPPSLSVLLVVVLEGRVRVAGSGMCVRPVSLTWEGKAMTIRPIDTFRFDGEQAASCRCAPSSAGRSSAVDPEEPVVRRRRASLRHALEMENRGRCWAPGTGLLPRRRHGVRREAPLEAPAVAPLAVEERWLAPIRASPVLAVLPSPMNPARLRSRPRPAAGKSPCSSPLPPAPASASPWPGRAEEGCRALVVSDARAPPRRGGGGDAARDRACWVHSQLCDVSHGKTRCRPCGLRRRAPGGIDVLINNAGLGTSRRVVEMGDDEWHKVIDVTLTGTFRMTRRR